MTIHTPESTKNTKNFFEIIFAPTPEIETKTVGRHKVSAHPHTYSPLFK